MTVQSIAKLFYKLTSFLFQLCTYCDTNKKYEQK